MVITNSYEDITKGYNEEDITKGYKREREK